MRQRHQPTVIKLTKIRQWYVPADAESYRALHKLRLTNVRYHEDFLPTLQLLTRKHHIRAQFVDFNTIQNEFLDRVTATWTKNPARKLFSTRNTLRFESKDLKNALKVFPEVEKCLQRFFRRWGFSASFEFSQTPTRAKLVVQYQLDKEKQPVIEFRTGV